VVKKGTDGGFLTHGVSIASLACDVLSDPDATEREAKPLGSSQRRLRKRGSAPEQVAHVRFVGLGEWPQKK
jgi:hypothetical protein